MGALAEHRAGALEIVSVGWSGIEHERIAFLAFCVRGFGGGSALHTTLYSASCSLLRLRWAPSIIPFIYIDIVYVSYVWLFASLDG